MKAIGGYFELADLVEESQFPNNDGVLLNTGRNALEYILRSIDEVKRIYLPYYTCEAVIEPIKKLHFPYTFYHVNLQFEIVENLQPEKDEFIIANNYFGLKDTYIQNLAKQYGEHLIVDCAQAFFANPIPGIKAFYSPRKFVGVADGGVAYLGGLSDNKVEVDETERTKEHDSHLLKRKLFGAEAGFANYQANEKKLDNQPIRLMSLSTKRVLEHIDYDNVITRRLENFHYLHNALAESNRLTLPTWGSYACPMVYPCLTNDASLKQRLNDKKIFVATYWPNVKEWTSCGMLEYELMEKLIPLPIDQRYGIEEMNTIISIIK